MSKSEWPAWFNGPKGETAIFDKAEDVPTGWTSGAEKRTVKGSAPSPTPAPAPTPTAPAGDPAVAPAATDVDAQGWPWSAELHASTKAKTKDGLWRMKVGVSRPAPKPLDL